MISIDVIQHLGEKPHGSFHSSIVPLNCSGEKIHPALRSKHSKERIFEQFRGSPDAGIPNSNRRDSGFLELIASGKELIERHLIAHLNPVLFKKFCIEPKNVTAVDPREYCVDLSILGH